MNQLIYDEAFTSTHDLIALGKLHLPSGRVAACDPYFCSSASPFIRQVSPGNYEVQLCRVNTREWGMRIAMARIVLIAGKRAISFEKAIMESTGSNTYFVDSGVGSFMDELTRKAFADLLEKYYQSNPRGNYYLDVLAAEFKKSAVNPEDINDIGKWNMHTLPDSKMNVTMFSSGLGDGLYESFWGIDEDGRITSLVTDFKIL